MNHGRNGSEPTITAYDTIYDLMLRAAFYEAIRSLCRGVIMI